MLIAESELKPGWNGGCCRQPHEQEEFALSGKKLHQVGGVLQCRVAVELLESSHKAVREPKE